MNVVLHNSFKKQYRKLGQKIQRQFKERITLFLDDQFHPLLNNHALKGDQTGFRSININGDIRAIYKMVTHDTALFVTIGPHSKLYRE